MESLNKIKKDFKNNIIKNSVEELEVYIQEQERFITEDKEADLLFWMIFGGENIPEFREKLPVMLTYYKKVHKEATDNQLSIACYQLRERLVPVLIEYGLDVNHKNDLGFNACMINILIPSKGIKETQEEIERKRKTIFSLLIKNNISLNLFEKGIDDIGFYELSRINEKLHHIDWIDSFYDEFNEKQKKEWKAIRLARLLQE